MATTVNKQRLVANLLTLGKKKAEPAAEPMPVLEEFIYGLCRENATREQADRAYAYLRERFFDWNEIRVSSTRELEEAFSGMSQAELRSQRLIAFLQEVFETTYSFDLDGLLKKGLKQAAKQLSRYQAHNEYVGAWVVQRSLGGHAIPLDPPTLRCTQRLGLVEDGAENQEALRNTLEHLIPKAKGSTFSDLVSQLAEDYCWEESPRCPACPMSDSCHAALEGTFSTSNGSAKRAHKPKPR